MESGVEHQNDWIRRKRTGDFLEEAEIGSGLV